ncbi:MAG TPA: ABC transporter permease [Ktedonobacteraceae bacterium]|jgi:peptide/nickel transport system permease protein
MDVPEIDPEAQHSGQMPVPPGTGALSQASAADGRDEVHAPGAHGQQRSISPLRDSFSHLWHDWRVKTCLVVLSLFVLISLAGPPIYQHIGGPYTSNVDGGVYGPAVYHSYAREELDRLDELPSAQYWLGTDELGRDILARLMQGMLISLMLAVAVELVDISLGLLVGLLAAYYGGWVDQLLARLIDLIFAFPTLLFLIMLAGILGLRADNLFGNLPIVGASGGRMMLIFISLALFIWPSTARLVRGQALQMKEEQFIEAARTAGTSNRGIMMRHILPNLISIVLVSATLDMAGSIQAEAGISLLGIGIQNPGSSLGLMISAATENIDLHPWEILVPSVVLAIIILAFSFLGDALQDAFNPRERQ